MIPTIKAKTYSEKSRLWENRIKTATQSHGKGVGANGGKAAVCQKNFLEQQHDDSENGYGAWPEQDRSQTGTGHMGTAAGNRGNLQGWYHEYKGAGHGQQRDQIPVLIQCFFDGKKYSYETKMKVMKMKWWTYVEVRMTANFINGWSRMKKGELHRAAIDSTETDIIKEQ